MMTFTYIIAAVILLGLCIFIHELGHLLGGKMVGIKAKVFSMGYGKGILKKKFGDTTYQITLIPFGGYCQFYGEDPSEERKGEGYEFLTAHPFRRIVTVAMGPLFNLFFGIMLFFIMNLVGYSQETNKVYIPEHYKDGQYISAAYKAGIKTGDVINEINGKTVSRFSDIQSSVIFCKGNELNIKVKRGNEYKKFSVKPNMYGDSGRYSIGVMPFGTKLLIAGVMPGDVADKAGIRKFDEIRSVDGLLFSNAHDFTKYIKSHTGKNVEITVNRNGEKLKLNLTPRINEIIVVRGKGKNNKQGEEVALLDSQMLKKSIADKTFLINKNNFNSFKEIVNYIEKNSNKNIAMKLGEKEINGFANIERRGFIGIFPVISPEMVEVKYGVADAFVQSLIEPYEFIVMNIKGMAMLFSGKMNVRENLSGPIQIAKIAGDVAYYKGISAFILLMAKISIILMVMNFLPIPVVDGGHLVFFTIEAIRKKPLSNNIMEKIQTFGVVLLIMLGIFVIFNDISRLINF